jgi:hypothetical protein
LAARAPDTPPVASTRTDVFELQDLAARAHASATVRPDRRRAPGVSDARTLRAARRSRRSAGRRGPCEPEPFLLIDQLIEAERLARPGVFLQPQGLRTPRAAQQRPRAAWIQRRASRAWRPWRPSSRALFRLPPGAAGNELFQIGPARHRLPPRGHAARRQGARRAHVHVGGLLKLLFTTETFALGINMPARSRDLPFSEEVRRREASTGCARASTCRWPGARDARASTTRESCSRCSTRRAGRGAGERASSRAAPEPVMSRFQLSYSTILHLIEEAWGASRCTSRGRRASRPGRGARRTRRGARSS